MSNRRISETLREEIARELGLYDVIKKSGWGAVTSRDCGNLRSQHSPDASSEKTL